MSLTFELSSLDQLLFSFFLRSLFLHFFPFSSFSSHFQLWTLCISVPLPPFYSHHVFYRCIISNGYWRIKYEIYKQRAMVLGSAATLYADVCGTVHAFCEANLALKPDPEPTKLRSTLLSDDLSREAVIVSNVDISSDLRYTLYMYPFKSTGNVPTSQETCHEMDFWPVTRMKQSLHWRSRPRPP